MANGMTQAETREMCANAAAEGLDFEQLLLLDRMIASWVDERRVTQGAVISVVRRGKTVFSAAYGKSGVLEEEGDVTVNHIFPMASITKPVVAALVCKLQEDGLLELSQRVRPHLHMLTGDEESKVRIWQLMTHTSGYSEEYTWEYIKTYIKDQLGLERPKDGADDNEWDEYHNALRIKMEMPDESINAVYFKLQCMSPPQHPPHTVMSYNSFGYELLAELIKLRSGMTLDGYAREKLFGPLGMNDTHWVCPEEKKPRYFRRGERFFSHERLNSDAALKSESGSGGLKSTAPDMARFLNMFLNKGTLDGVRVLSEPTVDMILTDHNKKIPECEWGGDFYHSSWGLGWNIRGDKIDDSGLIRSARAFNHSGHGGAMIFGDPAYDVGLAFFFAYPKEMPDWNWGMAHVINTVFSCVNR